MNSLLLSFGEIVEKIVDFSKTEQWLGLLGWIWIVIAAVVLVAVIVIIVAIVKGKKKKKRNIADAKAKEEEEAKARAAAEQTEAENDGSEELMVSEEEIEADCAEIDRIYAESLQRSLEMNAQHRKRMEAIKRGETVDESDGGESADVNGVTDDETIGDESGRNENNDAAEDYSESGVVIAADEQDGEEIPAEAPVYDEAETNEEQPAPVEEQSAAETPVETAAAPDVKKPEQKVYHISKRKADLKWQVKASKGAKAIKLFNTQAEAIDFAKKLAVSQDARIVIHKEDGSFRKITYTKNK